MVDRLKSLDRKRTDLMPGTRLVREWDRQSHRVMVLADGLSGTATYVLTLPEAEQPDCHADQLLRGSLCRTG